MYALKVNGLFVGRSVSQGRYGETKQGKDTLTKSVLFAKRYETMLQVSEEAKRFIQILNNVTPEIVKMKEE